MKKCVIMENMLVRLFTHCYIMLATFFIFSIHKNKKIIVINLHRHWDNSCEALQIKCILKHLKFFPTDMMNQLTDWSLSLFGFNQLYLLSGFSQYVYFLHFVVIKSKVIFVYVWIQSLVWRVRSESILSWHVAIKSAYQSVFKRRLFNSIFPRLKTFIHPFVSSSFQVFFFFSLWLAKYLCNFLLLFKYIVIIIEFLIYVVDKIKWTNFSNYFYGS